MATFRGLFRITFTSAFIILLKLEIKAMATARANLCREKTSCPKGFFPQGHTAVTQDIHRETGIPVAYECGKGASPLKGP